MIQRETLFVLGAGSSRPYDFPTGEELINRINDDIDAGPLRKALLYRYTSNQISNFNTALKHSSHYSIDAFLRDRPDLASIGKAAICITISTFENLDKIQTKNGDWYKYLFNIMSKKEGDFEKNKVAFLTFNYDRSLETFFKETLTHRYRYSENQVNDALSAVDITHVHGTIGELPWVTGASFDSTKYGNSTSENEAEIMTLLNSSKHIKLISEVDDDESLKNKINDKIKWAKRVYFLGFGYHAENMARINLDKKRRDVLYKGCCFRIPKFELEKLDSTYDLIEFADSSLDCLQFLKEFADLLDSTEKNSKAF